MGHFNDNTNLVYAYVTMTPFSSPWACIVREVRISPHNQNNQEIRFWTRIRITCTNLCMHPPPHIHTYIQGGE